MNVVSFTHTSHGGTETRRNKKSWLRAFVSPWLVIAALVAGCGDNTTPTTPGNTSTAMSETWSSVVAPGGQSSRSFTVNSSGTINVTLTAAGATLGLGVGLPRVSGGGCRLGVSVNAAGGSTPQISTAADAGQYCVQVYDLGTLTDPVGFALKIDHP
jgi:ABC-type transport system substrate-binding protein